MDTQTPETQTYVARAWYRDPAVLVNLGSFVLFVLADETFMKGLPDSWQHVAIKIVLLGNLWIRFQSSTRPVGLSAGTTREVYTIPIKGTGDGTINPGAVSDSTRSKL